MHRDSTFRQGGVALTIEVVHFVLRHALRKKWDNLVVEQAAGISVAMIPTTRTVATIISVLVDILPSFLLVALASRSLPRQRRGTVENSWSIPFSSSLESMNDGILPTGTIAGASTNTRGGIHTELFDSTRHSS